MGGGAGVESMGEREHDADQRIQQLARRGII